MAYHLGVDLGTTFTAAAVVEDGGPAHLLGLGNRSMQIPSVLYVQHDGSVVVGEAAERRGASDPARLVRESKRRIGDPVPIVVGSTPFAPQALSAKLLRWVVARAAQRMGGPPAHVVVTHPANWGPYKLDLMGQVVSLADLDSVSMLSEPAAAATQYASTTRVPTGALVAVYDLGGGTFDACILAKSEDGFEVRGRPEGIEHLGGIDFDEALFDHVVESLGGLDELDVDDPDVTVGLARLRRDCVEAKEALSEEVDAVVPVAVPGMRGPARVTRTELETLVRPSLLDTHTALRRALRSASVDLQDLHALVLVGGSSRMPVVGQLLEQELGLTTAVDAHPKHVIALGAVLAAGRTEPVESVAAAAAPPVPPEPEPKPEPEPEGEPDATQVLPAVEAVRRPTPEPSNETTPEPTPASVTSGARRRWLWVAGAAAVLVVVLGVGLAVAARWDTEGSRDESGRDEAVDAPTAAPLPQGPPLGSEQMVVASGAERDRLEVLSLTNPAAPRVLVEVDEPGTWLELPFVSADRRTVAFVRSGVSTGGEVWVVGSDGRGARALLDDGVCTEAGRGSWFPTSAGSPEQRVLLVCAEGLLSVDLGSGQVTSMAEMGDVVHISVDPTGSRVAVVRQAADARGGRLEVVDLASGSSRPLTMGVDALDGGPVWSADGSLVAFRRTRTGAAFGVGADDIWVTTVGDQPEARVVADDPVVDEFAPSWAPDGQRLAFSVWPVDRSTPVQIAVVDLAVDGATPSVVSPPGRRQAVPGWGRR